MCWAYRFTDGGIAAAQENLAKPHNGRITRAGQEAVVLTRRGGIPTWLQSRYGIAFQKSGGGKQLIWNARDDKLDSVETWSQLIRQRFAVPVDAYVENAPGETWYVGQTAWMLGFYDTDRDGGTVVITEQGKGDERLPIMVGRETALAWLAAQQWEALPLLETAQRIRFSEADLFEGKMLATDARTHVPIPKAA
jgi:putative SOS response-associated peptidase YedK